MGQTGIGRAAGGAHTQDTGLLRDFQCTEHIEEHCSHWRGSEKVGTPIPTSSILFHATLYLKSTFLILYLHPLDFTETYLVKSKHKKFVSWKVLLIQVAVH